MFLILGLGNPGKEYQETRHNLGFRVIDELAVRHGVRSFKEKHQSLIAETVIGQRKIMLAKPQTFMNNSGLAAQAIMAWHKIERHKLIVVFDDADLAAGLIRVREKGSAGGHHGIESVIASLGATEFYRVRIGIGREELNADLTEFVLQKIPPGQATIFDEAIGRAAEAAEAVVELGIAAAMNKFNR